MTIRDVAERLKLSIAAAEDHLDANVTSGYASDLLSCVMAKAQKGTIWVTLQAHPNVVAVAVLLELAGVIITEGHSPDPITIEKANAEGIPILTTPHTTFTTVARLIELGVEGVDQE